MSQPLFGRQGSAKVDKFLSDISIRYSNLDYVFPHVLPMVKVKEKTGLIPKYGKETLRILGKVVTGVYLSGTLRAPGARAKGVEFTYNQGQYICAEHSLEKDIPWDYYKNVDSPYEPTRDATAAVKDLLQLEQEFALATVLANISTIGNATPAYKWDNASQGTPVTDLENAVKAGQVQQYMDSHKKAVEEMNDARELKIEKSGIYQGKLDDWKKKNKKDLVDNL